MVHVAITAPTSSAGTSAFRVIAEKPRDDYKFGLIMTSSSSTVTVRGIAKDSVLALEGLQTGDVLVEINNKKIDSAKAVSWALGELKKGQKIELFVHRPPPDQRLSAAMEVVLRKESMNAPFPLMLEHDDSPGQLLVQSVAPDVLALGKVAVGDSVLLANNQPPTSPEEVWRLWTDAEPGEFPVLVAQAPYTAPCSPEFEGQQL